MSMDATVSTGDANTGTMELPDCAVPRVLRLIPVKQVFRLMRVNKLWRCTAQAVIRNKQRLQFGQMVNEWPVCVSTLDTIDCRLSDPGLEDRMWTSVMAMNQLTVLIAGHLFPFCSKRTDSTWSGLQRLLIQNRRTLTVVIMDREHHFPVTRSEQWIRNKWPVLTTLHCDTVYTTLIDSCPVLECVKCYKATSLLSLDSLKDTRLTQLEIGCVSGFAVKDFVRTVTQFRKLERLSLYFQSLPDSDHSHLNQLFCNTTRLTDVNLSIPTDTCMDRAVRQLIIRNFSLKYLVLTSMRLTDESMKWIARAGELSVVDIRSPRVQFSPDTVLRLLCGPSRLSLTEVVIHGQQKLDDRLLQQELQVMEQEVGHAPELILLAFGTQSDDSE